MLNNWQINKRKIQTEDNYHALRSAIIKNETDSIVRILVNPENARSFIVRRGDANAYIFGLLDGLQVLLGHSFADSNPAELLSMINRFGLPERILIEIMAAAYRLRSKDVFRLAEKTIIEFHESFSDIEVYPAMFQELSAWQGEIEHDYGQALATNQQALHISRDRKLGLLENKIVFGISLNKGRRTGRVLKVKDRIADFEDIARSFRRFNDDYDALRADLEIADLLVGSDLDRAEKIALQAHGEAREMGYANALIIAKEVLTKVEDAKNNFKKADSFRKEAEKLRQKYSYTATSKI